MALHRVEVGPLPAWLDRERLVGLPGFDWEARQDGQWGRAELTRDAAADLLARLRGVALDGRPLVAHCRPPLKRAAVRAGRLAEARRLREGTPGFERTGARLDEEGRFSLTPEALSLQLGKWANGRRVVDACTGCGGNAIGFARTGCDVVAIERDAGRLEMARHNAELYGVSDRIRFIHGNAITEVPRLDGDLLFVDPPWGEAATAERCGLADFPLLAALRQCGYPALWAKLPASFDTASLPGLHARAVFGAASGDRHRIKFLLLRSD